MIRVIDLIRRLQVDERGNALAIAAAAMPLILGAAGMAIDTIQLTVSKRQLQRAADSSAIAGARALAQSADPADAVHHDLDENVFPLLFQPEEVEVGSFAGFPQGVRVTLVAERAMPFISFFLDEPVQLTVQATAAIVDEGEYCMISLYDGTSAGIDVNGTADVTLGCGMATNSRASSAVNAGGDSSITATPIAAVGGIDGESNNFLGETTLRPHSGPQSDPFAHVPDPPAQSNCSGDRSVQPSQTTTIAPGCYSGLSVQGNLTLQPGTYYITGDVNFTSQANVVGEGVTLVMTGPNGEAGNLSINGQARLDLSAPDTGDYAGVLFFRDRRSSNREIRINGGADMAFRGAFYLPSSDIFFAGNAGVDVRCVQMVGQVLTFRGTAEFSNTCPNGASRAFRSSVVRLVG